MRTTSIPTICAVMIPFITTMSFVRAADLNEVVVTATKSAQRLDETVNSIGIVTAESLKLIGHTHINETLHRVPGVWISRGNGQEHLTAIRSPVLTGAGSCGAFLLAQDGVPLRAPGFCNVNELLEAATEMAGRIEVVRGPDSSIYGSNALHGVINVMTAMPEEKLRHLTLEAGSHDYYRSSMSFSSGSLRLDYSGTTDGGYKDDSGYGQHKLVLKHHQDIQRDIQRGRGSRQITTTLAWTSIDQETAGFVQGRNAYKNSRLKRHNPNPEAYRDASSFRLVTDIRKKISAGEIRVKPYLRSVDMEFLQHFLPGQPVEENGHDSLGVMLAWHPASWGHLGLEVEQTRGFLKETQEKAAEGSAFLVATLPRGKHYDYEITARLAGLYLAFNHDLSERMALLGSLRYQHTGYDYDNRMIEGRSRDDGSDCGFGGCRFNRPADRKDSFNNWSSRLGFLYNINDEHQLFGSLSEGFRAPQTTELYRLQNSQSVADIDPVQLDAVELGFRGNPGNLIYGISFFAMNKDNFIFQDTDRQNLDNGETSHKGAELNLEFPVGASLTARLAFTLAQHQYENNAARVSAATSISGNSIDTAPKTLGSATLQWLLTEGHKVELEWVHVGSYYEDPENLHKYEGHDLLHLRGQWQTSDRVQLFYRIMNITDEDYAERADFGFGSDRYFVGTPISVYLGLAFQI